MFQTGYSLTNINPSPLLLAKMLLALIKQAFHPNFNVLNTIASIRKLSAFIWFANKVL